MDAPEIAIVVAVAENGVIGREGGLPWRLSSDLKRFKALTMGKPIVMGRKTWDSLGRVLPGRPHIVISRRPDFEAEGVETAGSLDEALSKADRSARELGAARSLRHRWRADLRAGTAEGRPTVCDTYRGGDRRRHPLSRDRRRVVATGAGGARSGGRAQFASDAVCRISAASGADLHQFALIPLGIAGFRVERPRSHPYNRARISRVREPVSLWRALHSQEVRQQLDG